MYTYPSGASKFVPIAPMMKSNLDVRDTIKYNLKDVYSGAHAASIAKRNARERNRVKQVNDGFNALRKRLPASVIEMLSGGARRGSGKKLSKVDTLRMVVEYIRYLEQMIDESDSSSDDSKLNDSPKFSMEVGMFMERDPVGSDSAPSPATSDSFSRVSYSDEEYYNNNYCTSDVNMNIDYLNLLW